ncbi:hypothetical protein ACROYT_G014626 [Oculina patagonica]
MAEVLKKKRKVRGGHCGHVTKLLDTAQRILEDYDRTRKDSLMQTKIALTEKMETLRHLDDTILDLVSAEKDGEATIAAEIDELEEIKADIRVVVLAIEEKLRENLANTAPPTSQTVPSPPLKTEKAKARPPKLELPDTLRLTITRGEEYLEWSLGNLLGALLKEVELKEDYSLTPQVNLPPEGNRRKGLPPTSSFFTNNQKKRSEGRCAFCLVNHPHKECKGITNIEIDAQHNNHQARSLSAEDMGGLEPRIYLSKNARVILTCNLWTEVPVGLCHGAVGTVLDVICADKCKPPTLPIAIIVQFDEKDYSGPRFCTDIPNCVLLYPVTNCSDTLGQKLERQQYPLKLTWSITIHKAQGLTLNDVWIDLGPSERATGLTYVALTRAHNISNLVIELMTFDKLKSLKKTSNYKFRVLEEARLDSLSKNTVAAMKTNKLKFSH